MKDITYQTFVGVGPFPVDMLRYERCFPLRQSDAHQIYASIASDTEQHGKEDKHEVTVCKYFGEFNVLEWSKFEWYPK